MKVTTIINMLIIVLVLSFCGYVFWLSPTLFFKMIGGFLLYVAFTKKEQGVGQLAHEMKYVKVQDPDAAAKVVYNRTFTWTILGGFVCVVISFLL